MKRKISIYLLLGQIWIVVVALTISGIMNLKENTLENKLANEVRRIENTIFEKSETKQTMTASHERSMEVNTLERPMVCNITEGEYQLFERLVQAEAGGESYAGKLLVANVVINRVKSKKFPGTISGVIMQRDRSGAQFSPTSDGRINKVNPSEDTKRAVHNALYGDDISNGALYFVAKAKARPEKVAWFESHLQCVQTCGAHTFYR